MQSYVEDDIPVSSNEVLNEPEQNATMINNVDVPQNSNSIEVNGNALNVNEDSSPAVDNKHAFSEADASSKEITDEDADSKYDMQSSTEPEVSIADKLKQLSKSLSPPNWSLGASDVNNSNALLDRKPIFSSLTNLANKMMDLESKRLNYTRSLSFSLTDLDKVERDEVKVSSRNTDESSDACSAYSESEELNAYDKIKQESLNFDTETNFNDQNISEFQKRIKKLEYELAVANGTIKHVYDESTRKIQEVSLKYEEKIKNIDKQFIETIKQKDVLKISLDECMDARKKLQSNKENLIKSMSNLADDNERLRAKLHMSTEDCVKLNRELEKSKQDAADMKKQLKKAQDDLNSATIKVQWANTKLLSETDAHQLTRTKLSGMDAKIREAKEEANIIRSNCQALIDKYQNSEEIQSNALSTKIEKLQAEFNEQSRENIDLRNRLIVKCNEFDHLSKSTETIKDQLFEKHEQFKDLVKESQEQESEKLRLANQLEDLDERLNSYNELRNELKNAYQNNQHLDEDITEMREKIKILEDVNTDLTSKQKENLDYFQKISTRDAELQLEVNNLRQEIGNMKQIIEETSSDRDNLKSELGKLSQVHEKYLSETESKFEELHNSIINLEDLKIRNETEIDDLKNAAQVAKRKHQADSKDLVRQIEQFRKQFERQEESMRRSESINSIESTGKKPRSGTSSEAEDNVSNSNESGYSLNLHEAMIMLTKRLHSLQSRLAKRQEKLEFYESHVEALTGEVQKKSKIIQSLLLRVETGERAISIRDAYKGTSSNDESGSFWGSSAANNGMTLKLSQEINCKLQQVLEDTLYKNITLKENIKTLGDEIDRLNKK